MVSEIVSFLARGFLTPFKTRVYATKLRHCGRGKPVNKQDTKSVTFAKTHSPMQGTVKLTGQC
jgi:hypothetical protein